MLYLQEFDITITYKSGGCALSQCALPALEDIPCWHMTKSLLSYALTLSHSQWSTMKTLNGAVLSSDRKFIGKSWHFVMLGGIFHRKNYSSDGSITSGHSCLSSKKNVFVVAWRSDSRAFGIFQDVWKDSMQTLLAMTVGIGLQVRRFLSDVPKVQIPNRRYGWAATTNFTAFLPFWTVWYWPCGTVFALHAWQSVDCGHHWSSYAVCQYCCRALWLFDRNSKFLYSSRFA